MRQYQRVIVLCPAGTISGGPEALHQFAGMLRAKGVDAAIVYYPAAPLANPVPTPYQHYDVAIRHAIEDDPTTVIVIPEVVTSLAWKFPLAKKAIWWLSIDNYFKWQHFNPGPSVFASRSDLVHLCQSHYAYDFLAHRGVRPLLMLTDFLTEDAFLPGQAAAAARLPLVAYNPKRASRSLERLMAQTSNHVWLPLQNMDKTELSEVLRTVRLYVDFGSHPGRDRIPREAALCGAVVITGRKGSAGFTEDMPLPERFRLDEKITSFEKQAFELITRLLASDSEFSEASAEQERYRDWIRSNKRAFEAEVNEFIATMQLHGNGRSR
jgi:hypothetical protein